MKKFAINKKYVVSKMMLISLSFVFFSACRKEIKPTEQEQVYPATNLSLQGHLKQTKTYSSEVALKWQDMQLRILQLPAGPNTFGLNGVRNFAYIGVALYESVVPGMPAYKSLSGQLTGMPSMPVTEPGKAYHWPTSANAALAFMNRNFYTNTSVANRASMDSLENALNSAYQSEINNTEEFQRSVNFGRTIAQRIYDWSRTDGSLTVYPTYVPPVGPGLWAPAPPTFAAAAGPYWGNNRLFVQGSLAGTSSPAPPVYSSDPNSAYYAMVKEVYDISQTLTAAQTATALYFRDNPGYQAGTHYMSLFNQILSIENPSLDFYALAHVKTGISLSDAYVGCWKHKYQYNVDRPIRYIREVLNHPTWNPLFNTPGHPDFPSGHSQNGGAFGAVFTSLFGSNYQFTIHTYDYLGMAPRSYNSFSAMVTDIGMSRVYAGIHYKYSCEQGSLQGAKIATNVLNILQFKK